MFFNEILTYYWFHIISIHFIRIPYSYSFSVCIISLIKRIISGATRKRRRRHRSVRPSQRAHGPESPFAIAGVAWALHVIVKLRKFSKSSHLTLKMFVKSLSVTYQYINLIQSTLYKLFLLSKVLRRLQTTSFAHHDTTILSTTNLSFCVDYGRLLKKGEEMEIGFQFYAKVPLPRQVPGLCKKSWETMRHLQSNKSLTKQNALKWLKHKKWTM